MCMRLVEQVVETITQSWQLELLMVIDYLPSYYTKVRICTSGGLMVDQQERCMGSVTVGGWKATIS